MGDTASERTDARTRSLRWMEPLWEGTSTTAREENHKEEVLALFCELARESKRGGRFVSSCLGNRYGSRGLLGSVCFRWLQCIECLRLG